MTLTSADIKKIDELYRSLDRLHAERAAHQGCDAGARRRRKPAKDKRRENVASSLRGFTPEAQKEIREVIARDLRRRAAKIVEALHKYGCEAKLTEE